MQDQVGYEEDEEGLNSKFWLIIDIKSCDCLSLFVRTRPVRPPARRWAERRNWSFGFDCNNGKLTIKLYHKITEEFGFQIGLFEKILIQPPAFCTAARDTGAISCEKGEFVMRTCCKIMAASHVILLVWRSPERDSNTRPIDYKSIALDQLSYRGARFDYFVSSLKGFALRLPRSYAGTIFPGFAAGSISFPGVWNQIRKVAALPLFESDP